MPEVLIKDLTHSELLQAKKILEHKLNESDDLISKHKYCSVLFWLGRWPECIQVNEEILGSYPDDIDALSLYSQACVLGGKHQKNLENTKRLAKLCWDNKIAVRRGITLLYLQKYQEGFTYYSSILKDQKSFAAEIPNIPEWQGESLTGKRLIILGDQGFGDKFLFIRFLKLIREQQPAQIIFANLEKQLLDLFVYQDVIDEVVAMRKQLPEADYYVHMVKLPIALNITKHNYILEHKYLAHDPKLDKYWQEVLLPYKDLGLKIGIAWRGNQQQPLDRFRSIDLAKLKPLFALDNCCFFSLQKGDYYQQLLDQDGNINLIDLAPSMTDFNKTAALLSCLDVVITVDSALANLAGAMGLNAWLMLGKHREWRYGASNDKSWYPTLRIFEQPEYGDWDSVIANVKQALLDQCDRKKLFR